MSEYAVLPVLLLLALHPLQRITQGFLSYKAALKPSGALLSASYPANHLAIAFGVSFAAPETYIPMCPVSIASSS